MFPMIKKYPVLSHLLFWLGVLLLDIVSGDLVKKPYPNLVFGFCNIIPQIIASYFTVYYLIPQFFSKKKYFKALIGFLLSAYLISVFARILIVHVAEPLVRTPPFEQESLGEILVQVKWLALRYFPATYIMVFFFWLISFLNFSRENLSLQKEKASAELKMLKSQLNPHFLFNTLNNIYSLSLDNSPKTSESIGKLSEILDYVLYRCEGKFVPLSGEINLLENYIDLEKLRYDDRLLINFDKQVTADIEIAPLILLSLVENAFKHGAGEDGDSPVINIVLESKPHEFTFIISNSLTDIGIESSKTSIGLKNIKKQLDLLYPNQYDLDIEKEENLFTVVLVLYL